MPSFKKVFAPGGASINPMTTLLGVERSMHEFVDSATNLTNTIQNQNPEELEQHAVDTLKSSGRVFGAGLGAISGYHRFFAGFNARPSKAFNQRHAGIYDFLTLGIPFVMEYWAGRGMDKAKDLREAGKPLLAMLLWLPSALIKAPLAIVRWAFGVVTNICLGWIVKLGMKIHAAVKASKANEEAPRFHDDVPGEMDDLYNRMQDENFGQPTVVTPTV